jgi:phenylacetate-CoA ligase
MSDTAPDTLAYASAEKIEARQLEKLRALLHFLQSESQNEFYREKLKNTQSDAIQSFADLTKLPFTLKSELVREQNNFPPYGRNLSYPPNHFVKIHQTSGTTGRPLKVLDTDESWDWWAKCWTEVYRGAGVTKDDRVFVAFSFGPFIGFWAAYEGVRKLGALVIPGGGMDTEQRLAAIL